MLCIIRKGILVFLLACVGMLQAQQLKVIEFRADLSMTDAVQFSKNDFQGALCGLIKLGLTFNDVAFEGDIVAFEYHEGEWWIYMPKGSNYLSIKSRSDIFEPLYCKFPDYGIKGIESKVTYVMNVEIQSQKDPKKKIQPERKRRSSMSIAGLLLGSETALTLELYGKSGLMVSGVVGCALIPEQKIFDGEGLIEEIEPEIEINFGWQLLKGTKLRITPQIGVVAYFSEGEFDDFSICPKINLAYPITSKFVIGITPMYTNLVSYFEEYNRSFGLSLTLGWQALFDNK